MDELKTAPIKLMSQSRMLECPNCITLTSHYCDDVSCRCYDQNATEMADWGYEWNGTHWACVEEDD